MFYLEAVSTVKSLFGTCLVLKLEFNKILNKRVLKVEMMMMVLQ
jgi:hypothetical protein